MAKQYVLTEAELKALIDGLEFEKLRLAEDSRRGSREITIEMIHRTFHYHVVKWVQDVAGMRH